MWISRKDYEGLKETIDSERESRREYWDKLEKVKSELRDLKRGLMPTKRYQVIDTNSGLRYDVDAVDYIQSSSYDDDYGFSFRKADYSEVLSIHKDVSIQVVEEE